LQEEQEQESKTKGMIARDFGLFHHHEHHALQLTLLLFLFIPMWTSREEGVEKKDQQHPE